MPESEWKADSRALIVCTAVLLISLAIANPFVDSAFDDDWSYSHVALRLAQTGRFHYNGWGSPTILFQCGWAAVFIRAFGFSFNVLRFASLPFSTGFVLLTYLLARRVGLRRDLALFSALSLAVSPLFLPLAASFMTEPYACFFSFLCVYAAIRSAEKESISSGIAWLWTLAAGGILGGSDRQTVWIAPILLIPYLARLRQSSRRFLIHSAVAYLACLFCLCFIVLNFRPNYGPMQLSPIQLPVIVVRYAVQAAHLIGSVLLVTALMCLPAFLCLQPQWKLLRAAQLGALLLASLMAFAYLRTGRLLGVAPFLGNILTSSGILGGYNGLGSRQRILNISESYVITCLLLFSLAVWIFLLKTKVLRVSFSKPVATIFAIFAASYLVLLVPGALLGFCYDRYAIPLFPLLCMSILLSAQHVLVRIPAIAWACLLIFAAYGITTTHDYAQNLAARSEAVKLLTEQGISPLHISAGFEQDAWTQLQAVGTINNIRFGANPKSDYRHDWFWYYTTAIQPDYVAISSDLGAVSTHAILTIPFTEWVPPSKQAIYVVRRADIPGH